MERTSATGDAGVDGIISQGPLGLDRIYVQAKRYALDTAVGMGAGLAAAAALPASAEGTIPACGLGTGGFFAEDVAEPRPIVEGSLPAVMTEPDPARLGALAAPGERRDWWIARLRRCYEVLAAEATGA